MGETPQLDPDKYPLGVERELLERFLILIRDNYPQADLATLFLEQNSEITNIQGVTNLRDVLSHLATMLSSSTPQDKKEAQLHNAEEHLRRATIEPYEIAVNELVNRLNDIHDEYVRKVIPARKRYAALSDAPLTSAITIRYTEIQKLSAEGRRAKGKNLWSKEWEQGVSSFIDCYQKLDELCKELRGYIASYDFIALNNQSIRIGKWGIVATIVTFALGILIGYILFK